MGCAWQAKIDGSKKQHKSMEDAALAAAKGPLLAALKSKLVILEGAHLWVARANAVCASCCSLCTASRARGQMKQELPL